MSSVYLLIYLTAKIIILEIIRKVSNKLEDIQFTHSLLISYYLTLTVHNLS